MSHQDLFDGFMDPPPSGLDIDELIRRERKRQRWRRIGGALSAAVGVLVIAVGVTAVAAPGGTALGPAGLGPGPVGSSTPVPSPTPTPTGAARYQAPADQTAFDAEVSSRLTPVLQKAVGTALPKAKLLGVEGAEPFQVRNAAAQQTPLRAGHYTAAADVQFAAGVGTIQVEVGLDVPSWTEVLSNGQTATMVEVGPSLSMLRVCPQSTNNPGATPSTESLTTQSGRDLRMSAAPPTANDLREEDSAGGGVPTVDSAVPTLDPSNTWDPAVAKAVASCRQFTGPHGETMVTYTVADSVRTYVVVNAVKTDGTMLALVAGNWTRLTATGKSPVATMKLPPMTSAELMTVALTPGLTFLP
jgi:hypothetical protein